MLTLQEGTGTSSDILFALMKKALKGQIFFNDDKVKEITLRK